MNKTKSKGLEYRLYGWVPYNLSDKQKMIQFGHAAMEYGYAYKNTKEFKEYITKHKTFIVLDGGTTNNQQPSGMLNILNQLDNIRTSIFHEPDINDALTAIVLLADERVFNHDKYPCPFDHVPEFRKCDFHSREQVIQALEGDYATPNGPLEFNVVSYRRWVKSIGGENNAFLKWFLPRFKLA